MLQKKNQHDFWTLEDTWGTDNLSPSAFSTKELVSGIPTIVCALWYLRYLTSASSTLIHPQQPIGIRRVVGAMCATPHIETWLVVQSWIIGVNYKWSQPLSQNWYRMIWAICLLEWTLAQWWRTLGPGHPTKWYVNELFLGTASLKDLFADVYGETPCTPTGSFHRAQPFSVATPRFTGKWTAHRSLFSSASLRRGTSLGRKWQHLGFRHIIGILVKYNLLASETRCQLRWSWKFSHHRFGFVDVDEGALSDGSYRKNNTDFIRRINVSRKMSCQTIKSPNFQLSNFMSCI